VVASKIANLEWGDDRYIASESKSSIGLLPNKEASEEKLPRSMHLFRVNLDHQGRTLHRSMQGLSRKPQEPNTPIGVIGRPAQGIASEDELPIGCSPHKVASFPHIEDQLVASSGND
jgi:hypothetical protein